MRADARANRHAILDAAHRLYSRDPDVAFTAIAAEAGVGIGTLYRHFPTPDDLLVGLVSRISEAIDEICTRALARIETDPEAGWVEYARELAALRLGVLIPHLVDGRELESLPAGAMESRAAVLASVTRVVRRAQAAGLVRPELEPQRVQLGIGVLSRPLPSTADQLVPALNDWLLDVYLRGLRPTPKDEAEEPGIRYRRT